MEGASTAVALHLDPCTGRVMTTDECVKAYPTYLEASQLYRRAVIRYSCALTHCCPVQGWRPSKCVHVHVWCHFLRTAMVSPGLSWATRVCSAYVD